MHSDGSQFLGPKRLSLLWSHPLNHLYWTPGLNITSWNRCCNCPIQVGDRFHLPVQQAWLSACLPGIQVDELTAKAEAYWKPSVSSKTSLLPGTWNSFLWNQPMDEVLAWNGLHRQWLLLPVMILLQWHSRGTSISTELTGYTGEHTSFEKRHAKPGLFEFPFLSAHERFINLQEQIYCLEVTIISCAHQLSRRLCSLDLFHLKLPSISDVPSPRLDIKYPFSVLHVQWLPLWTVHYCTGFSTKFCGSMIKRYLEAWYRSDSFFVLLRTQLWGITWLNSHHC